MTTAAQIKKLAQPLLERNPELVIAGRYVFFKQVGHLLKGIYIDRCGDKDAFRPVWTVNFLIQSSPSDTLGSGMGATIYPIPEGNWYIDTPCVDVRFAENMEEVILPWLKSIEKIEDYLNISVQVGYDVIQTDKSPVRKLYVDLALGNFQEAENLFEMFSEQPDFWKKSFFREGHFAELMEIVRPMVYAENRAAIATKLHEWEAYSVKQLKLEKYWQATPFPIEM
jgi:hypothetical protein